MGQEWIFMFTANTARNGKKKLQNTRESSRIPGR